jgi:hypothetical protein
MPPDVDPDTRFAGFVFRELQLPAPADDLLRRNALKSLVRELGINYAKYHKFLVQEGLRIGGRPQPGDFESAEEHFAAWQMVQEIVRTEALLRVCRRYVRDGRPLGEPLEPHVPLVDKHDQLVSVE